jgi:flagellar protein FliO/FliZ
MRYSLPLRAAGAAALIAVHAGACAAAEAGALAAPAAASAPAAAMPTGALGGMFQVLPGLALVLVLIVACAWVAKRVTNGRLGANPAIRFVASQSLGARERVVIVEVGQQWLVLGVAPGRVNQLAQMARPETSPAGMAPQLAKPPFAAWLEKALSKK